MRKKKTLAQKKEMYKDTFDPNNDSRYANKKKQQKNSHFPSTSPFSRHSRQEPSKFTGGVNFFKPIDEV